MKALIVDDEMLARKRIKILLSEVPAVAQVEECSNGASAIEKIEEYRPDVLFLDVNMQDMNGFQVLQNLTVSPKPIVVFVTAYDYYALKAFDFDAFDFLLKPFKDERFFKTMNRVLKIDKKEADYDFEKRIKELLDLHQINQSRESLSQKLPIKLGNRTILVEVTKIHYISASGYYAEIFVDDHKYLIRESLNNLEEILDEKCFFRVHRSTIVNLNFIEEIVHSDYAEIDVRMKDKKLIRVSKSQKKEFLKKLGLR